MEDLVLLNSGSGIIQGSNISPTTAGSNAPVMGYLVEGDGTIKLPYLDKVKAEGLTRLQLENYISEKMKEYTKNPVVNVRFLNYRITVLGAVKVPGNFSIPTERVTVLEALGLAGDLTIFGQRENVLVVREVNGVKELLADWTLDQRVFLILPTIILKRMILYMWSPPGQVQSIVNVFHSM